MRRRRLLTIAWLVGGTFVPVGAAVAIFGCCHLPFHGVVHRFMPLCELAEKALAHHHHEERPAVPAPSRPDQKPTAERNWRVPERASLTPRLAVISTLPPLSPGQPPRRSLPVGAFRCDDDVGARLAFVDTLRL
ncbi:MAG TPA: hypothetical protein VHR45_20150 [Thermoanaerobaculia bacterium]|nr:hypothetical protein [Thermoanaerobaculia bacterium]